MGVCCWMERGEGADQVEGVVYDEEEGDHEGLGDFDPVDPCENIDAVWAEDGHGRHVDVIEEAEVEKPS